jgi:hypothetical protein
MREAVSSTIAAIIAAAAGVVRLVICKASPLNVKGVRLKMRSADLVAIVRKGRELE